MNSIPRKFLFFVAFLGMSNFALAQDGGNKLETFGASINRAMSQYFTAQVLSLLCIVLVLTILGAIFFEVRRANKVKENLAALAAVKFDLQAESLNLRADSVDILKKIAEKSELQDPSSILKFPDVFESSLDRYYESEGNKSISDDTLIKISELRKTLGFSPLPMGTAITSTRQLCGGDECTLQIPENAPHVYSGTCRVLDSGEQHWSVTRPEVSHVQAKTCVRMSLTRPGDAEYTFRTQVLRDSHEALILSHTSEINRAQQRNWMRVNVNIPVEAAPMEAVSVTAVLYGNIVNMSGGGFGITLPGEAPKGSMLLLKFKLPGHGQIADLLVKVVRVAGAVDGDSSRIMHSVTFAGELDLAHEKIIKYVLKKQRENLSGE